MIPNKAGYFWIKIQRIDSKKTSGWMIGEYSYYGGDTGYWDTIGNGEGWSDSEIVEIGPEIEIVKPKD